MDIYVFDKAVDSLQLAFRCDFLEQCINLLAYLHSRHLPFSISLLSMLAIFDFVCIALQSLLYKNICSISIFFSNKLFSILILRIKRAKISKFWKSSESSDTFLKITYKGCHIDLVSAPASPWLSVLVCPIVVRYHCTDH